MLLSMPTTSTRYVVGNQGTKILSTTACFICVRVAVALKKKALSIQMQPIMGACNFRVIICQPAGIVQEFRV
jgi:hypothetical protein